MFFLAVLVLGVYSFLNVPFERNPEENFPRLSIRTVWSGVPPEVIQIQISSPLEEAASRIKGVTKITSTSNISTSVITLEFDSKTNMEFATLALREEISRIEDELPYGAMKPMVIPYVPEEFQAEDFLIYSISGDYTIQKLRELVKDKMEFGIGSIKGVAGVEVRGGSDPEVKITMDREKLKALNLYPGHIEMLSREGIKPFRLEKLKEELRSTFLKFLIP